MYGPRSQKLTLLAAALFAVVATVYALVISIQGYKYTGMWYTLVIWGIVVATGGPFLAILYRRAWRLIDEVSKM